MVRNSTPRARRFVIAVIIEIFDRKKCNTVKRVNNRTCNYVVCIERDMLNASPSIIFDILGNLALFLAGCWFINGHFNGLLVVCHHDATERRIFRVNLFIIDGPKAMELQRLFVPLCGDFHLIIGLIANAMINEIQVDWR